MVGAHRRRHEFMAGRYPRDPACDAGQRDVDASLILVFARDSSFYPLFSLALNTWWNGRSQTRYAPTAANITGAIRLPVSITARLASSFYGQYRQFVAGHFKR